MDFNKNYLEEVPVNITVEDIRSDIIEYNEGSADEDATIKYDNFIQISKAMIGTYKILNKSNLISANLWEKFVGE